MNKQEFESQAKKYNAQLKEWDAEAAGMDASKRAEYEAERNNFSGRLDAWQDMAESGWDEFTATMEQGYYDMEARWHNWRSKE